MKINITNIDKWISYWKEYIGNYDLPSWDQIPDFGLYMEQVVTFLRDCLKYIDSGNPDEPAITASAINNYVRKKLMPQPVKKKYYRNHIAYLIILCALKQSLTISDIQALVPDDAGEKEFRKFYDAFVEQHKRAADYFIDRVESVKEMIVNDEFLDNNFKDNTTELIVDVALLSSFAKLLSERLILSGFTIPGTDDSPYPEAVNL